MSTIYFIEAEGADMVKIGWTSGPAARRLSSLQVGSPAKLKLVAEFAVFSREAEADIHAALKRARLHGEWFSLNEDVTAMITNGIESYDRLAEQHGGMKTVTDLINSFGGSSELARRINVPIPTVGAWKFRGSVPPEHFPEIVALAKELRLKGITFESLYALRKERAG